MKRTILMLLAALILLAGIAHAETKLETVTDDDGRVIQEDYLDDGKLVVGKNGFARHLIEYDEAGNAVHELYLDESLSPAPAKNGIVELSREYGDDGRVSAVRYLDGAGQSALQEKLGAYGESYAYDGAGNITVDTLLDAEGQPMVGPDGWARAEYVYDDQNRRVSMRYFDAEGAPALYKGDYSGIDQSYDDAGNIVRLVYYDADGKVGPNKSGQIIVERRYNEAKQLEWLRWLDAEEQPMELSGYYQQQRGYDENGNQNREVILDADGNRALNANGWCEHTTVYNPDNKKQKLSERFLGVDGEPVLYKGDYSGIDRVYDDAGNAVRLTYYDATGEIGPNKDGQIIIERRYNEAGQIEWLRWLDADGQPMQLSGYYQQQRGYDEKGNLNSEINLDAEGNRALNANGWCEHTAVYDPDNKKQKLSDRYYGVDGEPALYKGDYSGIDRVYDEAGNLVRATYYDATGEIGPNKDGVIIEAREYNEDNKVTALRYYDADDQPMVLESLGAAAELREYDESGNVCKTTCLGTDGSRTVGKNGWAEYTVVFNPDDNKQKLSERYYGVNGEPALYGNDYSGVDRVYDEAGNAVRLVYYDATGAIGPNKNGQIIVERRYNEAGQLEWLRWLDAENQPMELSGYYQQQRGYDENGNQNSEVNLDADGNRTENADGWCEHTTVYNPDNKKQKLSERYYSADGEPALYKGDYSGVDRAFDDAGNAVRLTYYDATGEIGPNKDGQIIIERRYNEAGQIEWLRWLDADEQPMQLSGYYQQQRGYDENGNQNREINLDADGNRALNANGWCEHTAVYDPDNKKQKLSDRYYGVDGGPALYKGEYSGVDRVYDDAGNVVRLTYYDATGEIGPNKDGQIIIERRYNEARQLEWLRWLDADGRPMQLSGYYQQQRGYDENGNQNREVNLDADGSRTLNADGWCEHATVYNPDNKKQKLSERYYGVDGDPALYKGDYSGIDRTYDEAGNVVRVTYHDATGEIGPNKGGVTTEEREYNVDGKVSALRYYGADGQPAVLESLGAAGELREYDGFGNVCRTTYLGVDGELQVGPKGWAIAEYMFDEQKHKLSETYYGADGRPCVIPAGYASVARVYDSDGNETLVKYREANGLPVENANGVAEIRRVFNGGKTAVSEEFYNAAGDLTVDDSVGYAIIAREINDAGQVVEERYFDTHGDLAVNPKKKCAAIHYEYDEAGNAVRLSYFGANAAPMRVSGYHTVLRAYDGQKHIIREEYLDEAGNLILNSNSYAAVTRRYDAQGQVTEENYFDTECVPTLCKQGYATVLHENNADKKPVSHRYFGVEGEPVSVKGYHRVEITYDANGRKASESYFDSDGNRTLSDNGYATVTTLYDANGKVLENAYFGADGKPVAIKAGYARILTERDAAGNVLLESYFDVNGNAVAVSDGYAAIARRFNAAKKVLSLEYLDADGNPALSRKNGYAAVTYDYDEAGNKIRESYFGLDREPIIPKKGGKAATTWEYNADRKVVWERYYGVDGNPIAISSGYASFFVEYSADNSVVTTHYLGVDGTPAAITSKLRYNVMRRTYNEANKLLKEEYLDANLQPQRNSRNIAGFTREYDEQGRQIRQTFFGTDGEPTSGKNKYAILVYEYDENGTRTDYKYDRYGNRAG